MRKVVFDIETKNTFSDIGRRDPANLDISVVGVYDSGTDSYSTYLEEEFGKLWNIIENADILIGFNSDHFDLPLLNKYYPGDLYAIKSLDLMKEVQNSLGRRIGLDAIASATLGTSKTSNGLQAVVWWKQGKIQEIRDYCIADVQITKEVYEYALREKHVLYRDVFTRKVEKVPLDTSQWEIPQEKVVTMSLGL
jgi:DEAD/DEAH box helicase domain-containing protein